MRVYSNYDFYISEYGGEDLTEFQFDRACRKASAYIDKITFGRADDYEETEWHELQICACEMAEAIFAYEANKSHGKDVVSVTNQGYTETYANGAKSEIEYKLGNIANLYLPPYLIEMGVD